MRRSREVNDLEQFVMLALLHRGDEAYGVAIRAEIEERSGRRISLAAVYAALDRLARARLVEARMAEPLPERGGRARKYFRLTPAGIEALESARGAMASMWEGVELTRARRG